MPAYSDQYWNSPDGLKLHYRDYDGPRDRPPILCIPGLTRNARDFEPVAKRFAGQWRVIAVDLRGRGLSDHDPKTADYTPPVYAGDLIKLLDQLGIADAVFVGTSLGGIITMFMALHDSERMAGVLLNDIGPELAQAGLDRIAGYVGQEGSFAGWDALAAALAERNADVFPAYGPAEWARFARRLAVEKGRKVVFDYDPGIAEPFHAASDAPPMNIWPCYEALAGRPVTILRGALTDLFALDVGERMASAIPDVELVTVPNVGHAPSLDEPESLAAIERLLARVLARPNASDV
ncbi:alpha/beta hydrolase [Sphingomonas sp.]|uniref:alpha/beta fold hydrolase n=1 Tax=Sphingomonas sp. TaxID=28214 RepID=UPI00286A49D9|nr:alpha/beta hydrolase [Sphingomonas sp.]